MPHPYLLMSLLYLSLVALGALASILTGLEIIPLFGSLKWLRVHLVTLGALTEMIFGLAPSLAATGRGVPRPKMHWDIWLSLNAGLLLLLIGIPSFTPALIIPGGTLVGIATLLLIKQLAGLPPGQTPRKNSSMDGRKFYLTGLSYLVVGGLVGTGLWLGWSEALRIASPIEVHVHTNLWGFTALILAGLLVDLYPSFAQRPLAWPRAVPWIYWTMALGALGLISGPWLDVSLLTVIGLVLHTLGTILLLAIGIKPLVGDRRAWTPGMLHLVTSYVWFFIPVVVAPLIVARATNFPVQEVAGSGGPILVFGWILQFGYALAPYLFTHFFEPDKPARLGGTWLSLLSMQVGSLLFWISLFFPGVEAITRASAYGFWILSGLPILISLWRSVRLGLHRVESSQTIRLQE
jgi:cytochrome c oxidase cbb3-type subunit I